jgi:hypothetical protein
MLYTPFLVKHKPTAYLIFFLNYSSVLCLLYTLYLSLLYKDLVHTSIVLPTCLLALIGTMYIGLYGPAVPMT